MKITPLDGWIDKKIKAGLSGGSVSDSRMGSGLSRDEIEAWQLGRLNKTLALARAKSPFYRKHLAGKPESLTSLADVSRLPFTTAEDVRCSPLQFVCVSQDEIQRVVTLQSSGTTGEPKRIYFTADDQELTIDFFGVGMSTFTEVDDRVLILLPGETPGSVGDLLRIGLQRLGRRPIPYGPVRDPIHALEVMQAQQVDCLVGSPTQVLGLARRWQPGTVKPRSVLLSTDYLPAAIVRILKDVWDCDVYNHYGASEMGLGGGVECAAHCGFHLREADLYFEIIDPESGTPLPEGDYGEVVFSTLTRRGMPLIRYRMGDRSRFVPGDCQCGTKLKTLEKVRGRFSGYIKIADNLLSLPDFDEALFPIPELLNFSVSVAGPEGSESLTVEAQMLVDQNATDLLEQALKTIPAIKDIKASGTCRHNPHEPGSILKRVILDKRGQHA
jgi:phenylacetate-coenzyme A ligase PaaK-like adenylate-forming protein